MVESKLRVINIYRSFSPQGGESQQTKFKDQITTVRNAVCEKFIILGDFNLDYSFKNDVNYRYSNMFNDFESFIDNNNLIQMVEFPTWSRIINNVLRESILDHIYVKDPTIVGGVHSTKPCFGDHLMISIDVSVRKKTIESTFRRDWRQYSKRVLLGELALVEWTSDNDNVQNCWDCFESKLVAVVDKIVPIVEFKKHKSNQSSQCN